MNIYLSKINLFREQILYNLPRNQATNYNKNIKSKKVVEEEGGGGGNTEIIDTYKHIHLTQLFDTTWQ